MGKDKPAGCSQSCLYSVDVGSLSWILITVDLNLPLTILALQRKWNSSQ